MINGSLLLCFLIKDIHNNACLPIEISKTAISDWLLIFHFRLRPYWFSGLREPSEQTDRDPFTLY